MIGSLLRKFRKSPPVVRIFSINLDHIPYGSELAIRRDKSGQAWQAADDGRIWFLGGFYYGLLSSVSFIHKASPMRCEPGYDSTGEAIGKLEFAGDTLAVMPSTVTREVSVAYNRKLRLFHYKDDASKTIDTADYLLLSPDGIAIAGWIH